ncbi:putative Prophage Lp2 protein 53 [Lactiplantibacillus plantarum]|nr:putative Prophage Lp2 protein 53 [Lactiplantibacillus plantarum]
MEKTLSFTDTSSQTVKIGDTTTSFTLVCGNDNTAVDLTHATSITVKLGNASGYLKSAKIEPSKLTDPTNGKITVTFDADLMKSLPAGNCAIEVWVVDNTGTSIYPSDGSTGFTITNNIQSTTGEVITTIAFDEFEEAMKKAASTIAKGDKGEKGDTPDLSNYTTVTDLNNGLNAKVTDNKNGTIEVNGSSITPADDSKVVHDKHDGTIKINGNSYTPAVLDSAVGVNSQPIDTDVDTLVKPGLYYVSKSAPNNPFKALMMMETKVQYDWNAFREVQISYEIDGGVGMAVRCVNPNNKFSGFNSASPWMILSDDSKVLHLSTGDTASRPTGISTGYQYFDTSLNKPIWYTGKNWVDVTGATV